MDGNICERWLPADDPTAGTKALLEVQQPEMPSQQFHLPVINIAKRVGEIQNSGSVAGRYQET